MHKRLSLYLIFYIVLFSSTPYNAFTLSVLLILFQYFYYLSNIASHEQGPFQFCTSCRKMTLQHYIHCYKCNNCVPIHWTHSKLMDKCSSEFHVNRYHHFVYLLFTYIGILLFFHSVSNLYFFGLLIMHIYIIYTCKKENNINIHTII